MAAPENAGTSPGNQEFPFTFCGEMMKNMGRCFEGKDGKIDFMKFCAKMSSQCAEMMKKSEPQKNDHEKNHD